MHKNQFLQQIMGQFYESIHKVENDNYDLFRNKKETERAFDAVRHTNFSTFFFENYDQFYATYMLFNDQTSKDLFIRLILFRLLGHNHINVNGLRWSDIEKALGEVREYGQKKSSIDANILGLELQKFNQVPFFDHKLDIDSVDLNLVYGAWLKQYYFDRQGVRVQPEDGDVVIDAGTCMGETTSFFAASVGEKGFVHGFDMLPLHLAITNQNLEQNNLSSRTKVVGYGVSNVTQGEEVLPNASENSIINPSLSLAGGQNTLPTVRIDDYVAKEGLESVDFIKMDIEGAELSALHGAAEVIKRHKPKLAISIYHLYEDYVTIPQFIKQLCPEYDFYLDSYTIFDQETILYAVARA